MIALLTTALLFQSVGKTHLIVVAGLAGEAPYRAAFAQQAASLVDVAKARWDLADSGLIYLAEDPATDRVRIGGRATKEGVLAALAGVARRARPDDNVVIVLIGHGSQQGDLPQFNLPGPDLTAADLAAGIAALGRQTTIVINTASASGGFLPMLAGPRRVVITATKTGFERNATVFGEFLVKGLTTGEADADKDERISVAEAYGYARREVVRSYEAGKRLLTEHSQLDDNGDGKGVLDLGSEGDGTMARSVTFSLRREVASSNPAVAALVATRRRLEAEIAALRTRKGAMDSTSYQRDLERLLVSLAETSRAIRAAEQRP